MKSNDNSKAKILVIEDEKGIRSLLAYELGKRGYKVDTANDGEEGVSRVKQEKYDLVISDIIMPKLNGLQVLNEIKKVSPETEVIMITGHATVENSLQSMKEGAYDFVQKPFNMQELFALIEKALEKSELKASVAIYESSQAVFSTLKLEQLLPLMIKLLKGVVNCDEVALLLSDHQDQLYLAAASFSMVEYSSKQFYITLAERFSASGKLHKAPVFINEPMDKNLIMSGIKQDLDIKSLSACPIVLRNKKFGILFVSRKKESEGFSKIDSRNLSIFVSQIAQSIANTKLYEQLEIKISELENSNQQLKSAKEQMAVTDKQVFDIATELKKHSLEALSSVQNILKNKKLSSEFKNSIVKVRDEISGLENKLKKLLDKPR